MNLRSLVYMCVLAVVSGSLGGCASTWGQEAHVTAFAAERKPAPTCHGTFTGGLTGRFYCKPWIIAGGKGGVIAAVPGGSVLSLGRGVWGAVPQDDMDPAGNAHTTIVFAGVANGALEARTYTAPELGFTGLVVSPPNTQWNSTGVTPPIFVDPHAVPPPVSPDFQAKLVLTSVNAEDPHGTLDLTLVEATASGPGAGRAKLHVDF